MRAVLLFGPGKIEVAEVDTPRPLRGWALVKVELASICGTDKAFYLGTYRLLKEPLIPGHEVVGVVIEGPENLIGKRVVPEINFSCWSCSYCRSGLYTHCPSKKTLGIDFDGGMAEYFIAPPEALHVFEGSREKGIFVEPLAAVLRALSLKPPRPGDSIAVIGTGTIAWLLVQVLRNMYKFDVYVIARRNSTKAGYFRGLANVVYADEAEDSYYDVVFEVSGDPRAVNIAVRVAKPMGVVHIKSTPGTKSEIDATLAVVKEINMVCSRCGTSREFRYAIELIEKGIVEPRLDKIYSLDEVEKAFRDAVSGQYFRVALKP